MNVKLKIIMNKHRGIDYCSAIIMNSISLMNANLVPVSAQILFLD